MQLAANLTTVFFSLSLQLHLSDRSLMPGDVVRRLIRGQNTQRGYCRNIQVIANCQIMNTRQVILGINSKDLKPLRVIKRAARSASQLIIFRPSSLITPERPLPLFFLISCTYYTRCIYTITSPLRRTWLCAWTLGSALLLTRNARPFSSLMTAPYAASTNGNSTLLKT